MFIELDNIKSKVIVNPTSAVSTVSFLCNKHHHFISISFTEKYIDIIEYQKAFIDQCLNTFKTGHIDEFKSECRLGTVDSDNLFTTHFFDITGNIINSFQSFAARIKLAEDSTDEYFKHCRSLEDLIKFEKKYLTPYILEELGITYDEYTNTLSTDEFNPVINISTFQ